MKILENLTKTSAHVKQTLPTAQAKRIMTYAVFRESFQHYIRLDRSIWNHIGFGDDDCQKFPHICRHSSISISVIFAVNCLPPVISSFIASMACLMAIRL